jgi:cell fate regulator YaaT (PSP1 superfamily)
MGQVGRFAAADGAQYARRSRVVCRTSRGLEVGEVLAPCEGRASSSDGSLLRRVTVQDDLLISRLERRKNAAFDACTNLLAERGLSAVLMDVDHLFDGQSLFFYFLGDTTKELEALTSELAETYEAKVQFRKFTESLTEGCGPDCGIGDEGSCGTSCSSCAIAGACNSKNA